MALPRGMALATLAAMTAPGAVMAQEARARPEVLSKLVACQKLTDDAERLRCADRNIAAFDKAEREQEVLVIDRAEMSRTRRSLFGLTLPNLKLFGGGNARADQPEFTTIETTLKGAQRSANGWSFTLEDGARWVQTDSIELARTPRPGNQIRIRKAAMGSFLANIEKQTAIRVRRVN